LIFPVNDSYPDGKYLMHFYNHIGKLVTGIPFNVNYTAGFVYSEDGVLYTQDHGYLDY
jgi:adenine C2-methylase RlmN of 23S rRNA A2503 and tRNA A37